MAVIYRHLKPCGEVFYIGIGKNSKRAYTKSGRNRFWKHIFKKYPDYEVQILKTDLSWEDACELEIILIAHYGRSNLGKGTLCNLTDGGDGVNGNVHSGKGKPLSEEHKQKLRKPKELTPAYLKARSEHGKNLREKFNSRVKYICIETLKTWGTLRECSNDIGIPEPTLSSYTNKSGTQNRSTIMLYEKYVAGERIEPFVPSSKWVEIIDSRNGEIVSKEHIAQELEIGVSQVYTILSGKCSNPTYYVLKQNYNGEIHTPEKRGHTLVKVINKETKEIYPSLTKAKKASGLTIQILKNRLYGKVKNNTPFMLLSEYEEIYGKVNN